MKQKDTGVEENDLLKGAWEEREEDREGYKASASMHREREGRGGVVFERIDLFGPSV